MANLRLYKDFYQVDYNSSGDTYILIDVFSVSATTNIYGDINVAETPEIIHESTGRYYVTLNANYYSFDYIYAINWDVKYVSYAPSKRLTTRFKLNPNNVSGILEIEVLSPKFDIIVGNKNIDIQI